MKIKKINAYEYFNGLIYNEDDDGNEVLHENNGESIKVSVKLNGKFLECFMTNEDNCLHVTVNIDGNFFCKSSYLSAEGDLVSEAIARDKLNSSFFINLPVVFKEVYGRDKGEFFCK